MGTLVGGLMAASDGVEDPVQLIVAPAEIVPVFGIAAHMNDKTV